jgi:hypothetical protein
LYQQKRLCLKNPKVLMIQKRLFSLMTQDFKRQDSRRLGMLI